MRAIGLAALIVFGVGVIGGLLNSLISGKGLSLPQSENQGGITIFQPGIVGDLLIGGLAALLSWGLYGPVSGLVLLSIPPASSTAAPSAGGADGNVQQSRQTVLTVTGVCSALLVGMAGARWLSSEVDKTLLRQAATQAALSGPSETLSAKLATAPPAEALRAAVAAKK